MEIHTLHRKCSFLFDMAVWKTVYSMQTIQVTKYYTCNLKIEFRYNLLNLTNR